MLIQRYSTYIKLLSPPSDFEQIIENEFSFVHPDAFWIRKNHQKTHPTPVAGCWQCNWNGNVNFYKKNKLPAGFWDKLALLLQQHNISHEVIDNRVVPKKRHDWSTTFTLREYQNEILDAIINKKQGIVEAACGAGKTVMATEAIAQIGVPTIIIVPTKIILNQFETTIRDNSDIPLGIIQGKTWEEMPVTVAVMAALTHKQKRQRAKDFLQTREFILIDEYHKSAAQTWFDMIQSCPAYYRIGQTATPFRETALEDQYLYACTGPLIASVKTDTLQDDGYLAKSDIRFIRLCVRPPNDVYGEYTDGAGEIQTGWHKAHWTDKYRSCIVKNTERNEAIANIANWHVERGEKVLILVAWTEQFDEIEKFLNSEPIFLSGQDTKKKSNEKAAAFAAQERGILMGSPVLDLGFDLPSIEVIVNAAAGEATGRTQQRLGRGLRLTLEKQSVRLYDFQDDDRHTPKKYFWKHAQARQKTFQELGQSVNIYDDVTKARGS